MNLKLSLLLLFVFLINLPNAQEHDAVQVVIDSVKDKEVFESQNKSGQITTPPIFKKPDYSDQRDIYSVDDVPHPKKNGATGYISDPDDYLSASDEQKINMLIWQTE
ncbi:MAG: hypothetical protein QNJ57_11435, partial [Flavobacteriaceae bacterium]|nr:hypothetical protein [Flavobacteriaceae bacterium]